MAEEDQDEKITIEITPFNALTIMSMVSLFERVLPEGDKLKIAVQEYTREVTSKISLEQISEAFVEKEIYEALLNIRK